MTIHITPEQEFSYVSFETNVAASDYGDLITRVIETFQPGKFVVTILANKVSLIYESWRKSGLFPKLANPLSLSISADLASIFSVSCVGAFQQDS